MGINLVVDENEIEQPGNPDDLLQTIMQDSVEHQTAPKVDPAPEVTPAPVEVPDKYKGKTVEDLITMHQNLESAYGRMANDLGTQRHLTDQLLDLKRQVDLQANTPPQDRVEITSSELLDNPTEALDKYLSAKQQNQVNSTDQRIDQLELNLAKRDFLTKHSDYGQVAASGEFAQWLQVTPYRARLAAQAAQGDYGAADDLLTEFKQSKAVVPHSRENGNDTKVTDPIEQARQAVLEDANPPKAQSTGKMISRATLMQLRLTNPAAYQDPAFQQEVVRAYAEGRVK